MRGYAPDMLVATIVDMHPNAKDVLLSFGLPCFKCIVADYETLEDGLRPHGIDPAEVIRRLETEAPVAASGKSAGGDGRGAERRS